MIGGSSRIPIVRKMIKEHFNSDILNFEENPDECVAEGASFLAFMIANPDNPLCTQLTFESLPDDEESEEDQVTEVQSVEVIEEKKEAPFTSNDLMEQVQ